MDALDAVGFSVGPELAKWTARPATCRRHRRSRGEPGVVRAEKREDGKPAKPVKRRGRPRKADEQPERNVEKSSQQKNEAIERPSKFDIGCPDFVRVTMPLGDVVTDDAQLSDDEDVMFKLEWRGDGSEWGVFGDGTYVADSNFNLAPGVGDADGQEQPSQESVAVEDLRLEQLHPGLELDRAQVAAIRALCERRSVIFGSPEQESEFPIVKDAAIRAYVSGCRLVYSSSLRRKNERVFALLAECLGEDNVGMDLGDLRANFPSVQSNWPRALVVSPEVLHEMVFDVEDRALRETHVVALDDFLHPEKPVGLWEEMLVAMPSRILAAVFCRKLSDRDRVEIPLWMNHVVNPCCKAFKLERSMPVQAYVFNPRNDTALRNIHFDDKGEALLSEFLDAMAKADEAALSFDRAVADQAEAGVHKAAEKLLSGHTGSAVTSRSNMLLPGGEPEADSAAVAQILLRVRGSVTPTLRSEHIPLLGLVHGREEAEMSVQAVVSAMRGLSLVDAEEEEALQRACSTTQRALEEAGAFSPEVAVWFQNVECGCAAVHNGLLPVQNALAQELFRARLIKILVVDTHFDCGDLTNLPAAKTVVVDGRALTQYPRAGKGVLHGSLVRDLAGARDEHEGGVLVVAWEDEDMSPGDMAVEAASALLAPIQSLVAPGVATDPVSILRTLHRFGGDDWQQLWTMGLGELRRSMDCEPLAIQRIHKSSELEQMRAELSDVDWVNMAKHTRLEGKVRERARVLLEMLRQQGTIWKLKAHESLQIAPLGTIVGLRNRGTDTDEDEGVEPSAVLAELTDVIDLSPYVDDEQPAKFEMERRPSLPAALAGLCLDERGEHAAVVVGTDGIFHLVPLVDVVAIAEDEPRIALADDLSVPMEPEFDEEPETGWKTCEGSDPAVRKTAERIAQELLKYRGTIFPQSLDEVDRQLRRLRRAEEDLRINPWFEQSERMDSLRRKRRRMVEVEKELEDLQRQIDAIMEGAPRTRSLPNRLASTRHVLDELNCTSAETGEITTMGMVTLRLSCPSQFWMMASILLTDLTKAEWFELGAGLVALCSNFSKTLGRLYEGGEYKEDFGSGPIVSQILDLRDNIRNVEDKHNIELEHRMLTPLDTRLTTMARHWAQGEHWNEALATTDLGGLRPGDVARVVRMAISVARQFEDSEKQPWILEDLQQRMSQVAQALDRAPVCDFDCIRDVDQLVWQARGESPRAMEALMDARNSG